MNKGMKMRHRRGLIRIALVVWMVVGCCGVSFVRAEGQIEIQKDVKIPMRDGVRLSANVYRPRSEGRFPVLLARTPYGKDNDSFHDNCRALVQAGYVAVVQDCRGKGLSGGSWDPFVHEKQDGLDTHQWILRQGWANGKVGTFGGSYVGFTQWAPAPEAEGYLKAMLPMVPLMDPYYDVGMNSGGFRLSLAMGWGAGVAFEGGEKRTIGGWGYKDWFEAYLTLPLSEWDKAIDREVPYLREWVQHYHDESYWRKRGVGHRLGEIEAPILVIGGWYDIFCDSVLHHINTLRRYREEEGEAANVHLLMGPWVHSVSCDGRVGAVNFGRAAVVDIGQIHRQWFAHWLQDTNKEVGDWPAYRLFIMGINQWRNEKDWPLERTQYTPYYWHSNGNAAPVDGDGRLSIVKPDTQTTVDSYVYDPADPVPSRGGGNLFTCPTGPFDQREVEKRRDVLIYTSERLDEELEVTGPVRVVLYAATDAVDTDWTAKLVDVYPDGRAINLCDGMIRARYRNSISEEKLLEPGKIYRYEIKVGNTSNVFLKGHRIRVEISSSNFPRFARNLNTGEPFGQGTAFKKAHQRVYHDRQHPSHILLPVIPSAEQGR